MNDSLEIGVGPSLNSILLSRQIAPNSCSNVPVAGNFTEECLDDASSCSFPAGQADVTSSLLFSSSSETFPQMSRVCDASTHDQDSPNKQNLLCGYRELMHLGLTSLFWKKLRESCVSLFLTSHHISFRKNVVL